jgi:hypothetical protein
MAINMALKGVSESLGIMIPFLVLTALNIVTAVLLFQNIKEDAMASRSVEAVRG